MWSSLKKPFAGDEADAKFAIVATVVIFAVGGILRFTHYPAFRIYVKIVGCLLLILGFLIGLAALVIGPLIIYMFIIEPLRDWYIERKYRWARPRDPRFREWLTAQVNVLRELGFLEAYAHLSEKQQLSRITTRLNKQYTLPTVVHYPCLIGSIDPQRALLVDSRDDRRTDSDGYVELVQELAGISRGAFAPEDVSAATEGDGKWIRLRFRQNGNTHDIRVNTEDGSMDTGLIDGVNCAIQDSGYRFDAPSYSSGQECYVFCLRESEKADLQKRAGWRF